MASELRFWSSADLGVSRGFSARCGTNAGRDLSYGGLNLSSPPEGFVGDSPTNFPDLAGSSSSVGSARKACLRGGTSWLDIARPFLQKIRASLTEDVLATAHRWTPGGPP